MNDIQEVIQLNQDLKNAKGEIIVHLSGTIYTGKMDNSQTYENIVNIQEYLNNIDTYQTQKADFQKAFIEKLKSIYQVNATSGTTTTTTN